MDFGKKTPRIQPWLGVALLQLVMTQVVTFVLSMFLPGIENFQQTRPLLFAVSVGISFSTGVFLAGWLALRLHWLSVKPKYLARLVCTLLGAYLPLILALFLYPTLEAGNPFFFISILVSMVGFYLPDWIMK